jgi:hypothetical protein
MPFGSVGAKQKGATGPAPMSLECVKRISFPHKNGEAPQSPQRLTLIVAKSDGEWQHSAFLIRATRAITPVWSTDKK